MFFKLARQGENHFGQYAVTIALTFLGLVVGNVLMVAYYYVVTGVLIQDAADIGALEIDNTVRLIGILMPFIAGLLSLLFCISSIHKRPFLTALTSRHRLDWSRIFLAFGLWILFNGIFELINYYISPGDYTFRMPTMSFLFLLVVALALLPLQIAFEEVLFRGYLMQGTGLLFGYRWVALVITSVAFGALHLANPEVLEYGLGKMMFYYIGVGFILGVIAIMDDGLELALGIHAATNIYSAVLVSYDAGALQTDALFHSSADMVDSSVYSFIAFAVVFTIMLSRIYKWKNWNRLWERIEPEMDLENTV